jgi:hypothetical protein
MKTIPLFALMITVTIVFGVAQAAEISANQEADKTIRVVVPDLFELTCTKRKGFVAAFFDLKHDPQKRHDLAPVLDENGILWTKTAGREITSGDSWYANPPATMELLEAGPVRVRIRLAGPHHRYGYTDSKAAWSELGFAQTFTIYPTGNAYIDYTLETRQPVPLHHFLLIIKSAGSWGNQGQGVGKGEVHCAGEFGAAKPYGQQASSFALQWSDGPTHFQDILMVMQKGRYVGTYWNEGYRDKDVRAGLDLMSRWPDKTVPVGEDHIHLLMRFAHDLNSPDAVKPYAEDYRAPDRLEVSEGTIETADRGDRDADGFNEAEGCYVMNAGARGVAFVLHGRNAPRMSPVFKIKGWTGPPPNSIALGQRELLRGKDVLTSVRDGSLLVQILENVREDAKIEIRGRPR